MDIRIEKLCKSYGENRVLTDFSAVFPEGETSCVMGASGCGKTTLLRLLLGLEKPDGGTILGLPEKISAVFQEDRLAEPFSAEANLALVTGPHVPRETLRSALSALGLSGSLDKPVRELSGGMRRRVAIARALVYDAPLLLLDEPFKGLDEETKKTVMDYVKAHAAGKTVILVTHDEDEAEYLGIKTIVKI